MADHPNKNKNQKPHNRWIVLTGAGIQMGVVIFITALLGDKIDDYLENSKPWFTLIFVLFGVFVSIYLFIKQVQNLDK